MDPLEKAAITVREWSEIAGRDIFLEMSFTAPRRWNGEHYEQTAPGTWLAEVQMWEGKTQKGKPYRVYAEAPYHTRARVLGSQRNAIPALALADALNKAKSTLGMEGLL